MSQCSNTMGSKIQASQSMMTYREYYMTFTGKEEPYLLTNGWGWFVDIETNSESTRIQKYQKTLKNILIPETIHEYPSIRSMKSMKNLHDIHDIYKIFDIDDIDDIDDINDIYDNKHRMNSYSYFSKMITHSICLIGIIVCYYFTF